MLKQYYRLDSDMWNNFLLCQSICRKVISNSKINLILATIETPVSFIVAEKLYHYPLLHKYLNALNCISIDPSVKDFSKMKCSIGEIKPMLKKHNLCLFPEGACGYHNKQIRKFKRGIFLGVVNADIKIIPTFIDIQEITNIGLWMVPKKDVQITFGDEFVIRGQNARELVSYAQKR